MSAVTEAQVLDALRPIVDPDFRKSIVELGFVKNVRVEGSNVGGQKLVPPCTSGQASLSTSVPPFQGSAKFCTSLAGS